MTKISRLFVALAIVIVAVLGFMQPKAALADRPIFYFGENPLDSDMNLTSRFVRDQMGTFMMQALGLTVSGNGAYAGLAVTPIAATMTVQVGPSATNTLGLLMQAGPSDAAIPTAFSPQLAADNNLVLIPYLQSGVSPAIGPLPAPTSTPQSIIYLIEAQGNTVDNGSQTRTFYDSSGNPSNQTVNTVRADQITYQSKAGAPAASPTPPAADSGFIAIATVKVPFGASSSASFTIAPVLTTTVAQALGSQCGFCVSSVSPSSPLAASIAGQVLSLSCATCVTGATGTSPIVSSGGTTPAISCPTCVVNVGNSSPVVSTGGVSPTISCPTCVTSVTGSGNMTTSGGTTPNVTITSAPSFAGSVTVGDIIDNLSSSTIGSGNLLCRTSGTKFLVLCSGNNGGNFPDHGTVTLINSTDGCSGITNCATMGGSCATATTCGQVQFSTTDGACLVTYLAQWTVGGASGDVTPTAVGWAVSNAINETTGSNKVQFLNLTGSSFTNTTGNALMAGYTCLY